MPSVRSRAGAVTLAAVAGVSVWVSCGTQAITNDATVARVAAFPPLWLLGILVLAAASAAFVTRLSLARAWPLSISGLLWLPYLPGEIPAAFLLWQGPIECVVWLAVAVGVAGGSPVTWWPRLHGIAIDPKRAPWLAGATVAVCAFAGFSAVRGVVPGGDEPHYLAVTQSLLLDGDLRVENNYARGDYLSYFAGRLRPDYLQRGADREIYSIHAPGISAVLLPAFAVAGYAGAVAMMIAGAALAAALTWYVAWLLFASAGGAWVGCAAVFLTAPFFFHTFAIYPDGVAALLVMIAMWLLVRLESGREVSRWGIWAAGISLAALPWLHTRFAVIAASFGLIVSLRLMVGADRRGRISMFLTVPVLSAAAWLGYFWMIWGTPSPSAPYGADTNSAIAYIGRGATGLLIDQQFGLIATAPIFAVAIGGLLPLARRHPRFTGELLLIVVPYLFAASSYAMWWGGTSAPARFLVALMPIAALPIAWWWSRQSSAWRALTLLVLLLSVVMVLPRAWVDGGRLLYNGRTGFDLVLDWASRSVDLPLAFPSVHREAAHGAARDSMVWLAAGLIVAAVAQVLTWRPRRSAGATWTLVTLSAAIAAMLASTVVWARHGDAVITANRSSIAALSAFRPAWHTTVLQLRPFRVLEAGDFPRRMEFGTTDRLAPGTADPTMLRVAALPAGDYEVVTSGGRAPRGELTVVVGRNDPPIELWRMDGRPPGQTGLALRLPVAVASATIRGDGDARATVGELHLRANGVRRAANPDGRRAVRAARYGRARVFFFDEQAYLEPAGFWTRAEGTAAVVIDADKAARAEGLQLTLRAGAVPTTIELTVGEWARSVALSAGQSENLTLPALNGPDAWSVTLRSGAGFRPSALDPSSDDVRHLAVWVEIP